MTERQFGRYGKVRAVFEPKRLDTMKPSAKRFIGREAIFEYAWEITEEDGGPYVGQYAMQTPREWDGEMDRGNGGFDGFFWVPEDDLRILEVVHPGIQT